MAIDPYGITNNTNDRTYGEKLVVDWANSEGFTTFALDHAVVMRNLAHYIDKRLEEKEAYGKA